MHVTNHTGNGDFNAVEIRPTRQLESLEVALIFPDSNRRPLGSICFNGYADQVIHDMVRIVNLTVPEVLARYQWYRIHRDHEELQFALVHDTLDVDVNKRFEASRVGRPARVGATPQDAIRHLFPQSRI